MRKGWSSETDPKCPAQECPQPQEQARQERMPLSESTFAQAHACHPFSFLYLLLYTKQVQKPEEEVLGEERSTFLGILSK